MRQHGEATTFFARLMPYHGGHALHLDAIFTAVSGASSASTLDATLA